MGLTFRQLCALPIGAKVRIVDPGDDLDAHPNLHGLRGEVVEIIRKADADEVTIGFRKEGSDFGGGTYWGWDAAYIGVPGVLWGWNIRHDKYGTADFSLINKKEMAVHSVLYPPDGRPERKAKLPKVRR